MHLSEVNPNICSTIVERALQERRPLRESESSTTGPSVPDGIIEYYSPSLANGEVVILEVEAYGTMMRFREYVRELLKPRTNVLQ